MIAMAVLASVLNLIFETRRWWLAVITLLVSVRAVWVLWLFWIA